VSEKNKVFIDLIVNDMLNNEVKFCLLKTVNKHETELDVKMYCDMVNDYCPFQKYDIVNEDFECKKKW